MQSKMKGITLIEILLVLAIIGIIIVALFSYIQQRAMQMRLDRTSTQMQQILNAALSYYVSNGKWPITAEMTQPIKATESELKTYLPLEMRSPWNSEYMVSTDNKLFYVDTSITKKVAGSSVLAFSDVIAGTLPLSYTSTDSVEGGPPSKDAPCEKDSTICYIVAGVNIPGQNLNNATAVNFAGLYHNGACIPVPTCPMTASGKPMLPQIFLTPVQVSGTYGDTAAGTTPQVVPLSGFTVFTRKGGPNELPPACDEKTQGTGPKDCPSTGGVNPNGLWRACIQVITEKGELEYKASSDWSRHQVMMAVTRCAIENEDSGTNWDVHDDNRPR